MCVATTCGNDGVNTGHIKTITQTIDTKWLWFLSKHIIIGTKWARIYPISTSGTSKMTSSNGNIFGVTSPLCGEFTGHRWISLTKASDVELWCFLWSSPGQMVQTPSRSLWRHCNEINMNRESSWYQPTTSSLLAPQIVVMTIRGFQWWYVYLVD